MWRVAPIDVRWDSKVVHPKHLPTQWGGFDPDGTLLLKDSRTKYWANTLVSPNCFHYLMPRSGSPDRPWEQQLVLDICRRITPTAPLRVRLFSTPGSRNEYYGEWVVERLQPVEKNRYQLTLRRLEDQSKGASVADEAECGPRFRSRNEERHAALRAAL